MAQSVGDVRHHAPFEGASDGGKKMAGRRTKAQRERRAGADSFGAVNNSVERQTAFRRYANASFAAEPLDKLDDAFDSCRAFGE